MSGRDVPSQWIGEILCGFTHDPVEVPDVGDTLQFVFAGVFEAGSRSGDEVFHCARDQDVARPGRAPITCAVPCGPLSTSEVMVNGPDDVFVAGDGRIDKVPDWLFEGQEPVLRLRG